MEFNQKPGWIELICGPMFAGKSEELIRRSKRMDYAHQKYICFKPEIDNRYSESEIVSHAKNRTKSININHSSEIEQYLSDDVKTVIIDEIQFLDEGIVDVCSSLAKRGKRVIVAGLDMDFRGVPFKNTALFLAISEYVTKLTAICVKCGAPATMTQRVINGVPANYDDPIIVVGASESYEPRCRHCHEVKYKK